MIRLPRVSRARRSTIVLVFAVAALAFPLGVWANHQFDDVPTGASYHDDVEALVGAGVTSGCGGGNYCPSSNVTRAQMAQFLNRLGSLDGDTAPSVNARSSQSTDGWSLGCPGGTVWSQGLCFETSNHEADSVYDAADICASSGPILGGHRYRLPTVHELRSARGVSGINIDATGEHTDSLFSDDDVFYSIVVTDGGAVTELIGNTLRPFRCVTPPMSVDPFIICCIELGEGTSYPAPPEYGDTSVDANGRPAGE